MKISDEVKAKFKPKVKHFFKLPDYQCWKELGEMGRWHAHTPTGNCILKNWSNDAVNYVNKKGQSK